MDPKEHFTNGGLTSLLLLLGQNEEGSAACRSLMQGNSRPTLVGSHYGGKDGNQSGSEGVFTLTCIVGSDCNIVEPQLTSNKRVLVPKVPTCSYYQHSSWI
jgi:hypothetical protein